MIKGKNKTEATYRADLTDSSSSLKDFSIDRKKYFRRHIKGENVEDKDNQAVTMGRIVETLLLEPEEFDNKFYLSACHAAPTAMMLDFVEELYACAKDSTNEDGIITKTFDELTRDAHEKSKFKLSYEAVMNKFLGSDAEIYYREICTVREKNLTVINANDVSFAQRIVDELKSNFVTRDIVNMVDTDRYAVLNQFQVDDYYVDGLKMKSMIDKIIVDHKEKRIYIYDLKCTWNVENFLEEYYLYRRSYIQGYVYNQAILSLATNKEHDWYGYNVESPIFMVCDSTNYYNPLLYKMSIERLKQAYEGFIHKRETYPGVRDIVKDLLWALDNNIWNISRTNHESNGVVIL